MRVRRFKSPLDPQAGSLYECKVFLRAAYGLSAIERSIGTIRKEKGTFLSRPIMT